MKRRHTIEAQNQRLRLTLHAFSWKGKNAIGTFAVSNDLKYVAVTIIPGGSENDTEIHVIETGSGREIGDAIHRCCIKSNPMWMPDSRSFVYGRLQDLPANASSTE
jgi:hypothetical protein